MEQVVDAERRRLDVSVVHRELVHSEGRANGKVVQPYILILNLGSPICRKGPLEAAPTIQPVWELDVLLENPVVRLEMVSSYPTQAPPPFP